MDVVGIFEEAPRETQIASKSFVPANVFLFAERLLNQGPAAVCRLCTGRYRWTGVHWDDSANGQVNKCSAGSRLVSGTFCKKHVV
jgi:hypothetical protein